MGTGWAGAAGAQSIAQDTGDITSLLAARLMAGRIAAAQAQQQAMDTTGTQRAGAAPGGRAPVSGTGAPDRKMEKVETVDDEGRPVVQYRTFQELTGRSFPQAEKPMEIATVNDMGQPETRVLKPSEAVGRGFEKYDTE